MAVAAMVTAPMLMVVVLVKTMVVVLVLMLPRAVVLIAHALQSDLRRCCTCHCQWGRSFSRRNSSAVPSSRSCVQCIPWRASMVTRAMNLIRATCQRVCGT